MTASVTASVVLATSFNSAVDAATLRDDANIFKSLRREEVQRRLDSLEKESGFELVLYTKPGLFRGRDTGLNEGLSKSPRSLLVLVDPTSPNVLSFSEGTEVRSKVSPLFFTELQGR